MHIPPAFYPNRPKPYNHDFLFPKLITDIWKHQLDIWKTHQKIRHSTPEQPYDNNSALTDLQSQVRYIHTLAEEVLQTQRQRLFTNDLECFIATSTANQLRNYIDVYYPAIRLSIRQAKRRSRQHTRPLSAYGFRPEQPPQTTALTHTDNNVPTLEHQPQPHTAPHNPPPTAPTPRLHQRIITWARLQHRPQYTDPPTHTTIAPTPTTRAPHHKHSRWRSLSLQRQRFLSFFWR